MRPIGAVISVALVLAIVAVLLSMIPKDTARRSTKAVFSGQNLLAHMLASIHLLLWVSFWASRRTGQTGDDMIAWGLMLPVIEPSAILASLLGLKGVALAIAVGVLGTIQWWIFGWMATQILRAPSVSEQIDATQRASSPETKEEPNKPTETTRGQ